MFQTMLEKGCIYIYLINKHFLLFVKVVKGETFCEESFRINYCSLALCSISVCASFVLQTFEISLSFRTNTSLKSFPLSDTCPKYEKEYNERSFITTN